METACCSPCHDPTNVNMAQYDDVDCLDLNTEGVDILSFEDPLDYPLAISVFRKAIDKLIARLQSSDGSPVNHSSGAIPTTMELETADLLLSKFHGQFDQTACLQMFDCAFILNVKNDDNDNEDCSLLQPAQYTVLTAVILYNMALTHHIIAITNLQQQTENIQNARSLYQMAYDVLDAGNAQKPCDDMNAGIDKERDFLLIAIVTNMAHICSFHLDQSGMRHHLACALSLVQRMYLTGNKYVENQWLIHCCMGNAYLLQIPGQRYAPAA